MYCQWISTREGKGGRLVAIWMDREMQAFEYASLHPARIEEQAAGAVERTGERPLYVWSDEAREIHDEEARQA